MLGKSGTVDWLFEIWVRCAEDIFAVRLPLHGGQTSLSCYPAAHQFRPLVRFADNVVWHWQPVLLLPAATSSDFPRSPLDQSITASHWFDLSFHRTGPRLEAFDRV